MDKIDQVMVSNHFRMLPTDNFYFEKPNECVIQINFSVSFPFLLISPWFLWWRLIVSVSEIPVNL